MGLVSSPPRPRRFPGTTKVVELGALSTTIYSTHNCFIIPLIPRLDDFLRLVYYVVHDHIIVVDYLIEGTARDILQRRFVRVTIVRMSLCLTRSMLMVIMGHIRPLVTEGGDKWQCLAPFGRPSTMVHKYKNTFGISS